MNASDVTADVTVATAADVAELADIAARTFPLACPPGAAAADIDAFIADHLSPTRFADYVVDPARTVLVARLGGRITGYAMAIDGAPTDDDVDAAVTQRPALELSKIYVLPDGHGHGVAAALMAAVVDRATRLECRSVWLGVNQDNARAQRFYAKHGFIVAGVKTFALGASIEHDYVLVRPIP